MVITHNNYQGERFTGPNGNNFVAAGKLVVTNLPLDAESTTERDFVIASSELPDDLDENQEEEGESS